MKKFLLISLIFASGAIQAADQVPAESTADKPVAAGAPNNMFNEFQSKDMSKRPHAPRNRKRDGIKGWFGYGPLNETIVTNNPAYKKVAVPTSEVTSVETTATDVFTPTFNDLQRFVANYKSSSTTPSKRAHYLKQILAYVGDDQAAFDTQINDLVIWTSKIQGQGTFSNKNVIEIEYLISALFNEELQTISSTTLNDKVSRLQWALAELNNAISRELSTSVSPATSAAPTPVENAWKKWAKRTGWGSLVTAVILVAASAERI
jgi:hypothetical protein